MLAFLLFFFLSVIAVSISMYIMCVILCLFSALSRRAGVLQISIIIIINRPFCSKHQLASFLTLDTKERTALNNWSNESSGLTSDTSVKIVKYESVEQLSATPLHSTNKDRTRQRPCIYRDTARENIVNTVEDNQAFSVNLSRHGP